MASLKDLLNDDDKYDDKATCDFINKHPASCRVQSEWSWGDDNKGKTTAFPLSRICMNRASLMAVVLAYNACPLAVSKADSTYGATPLYYACLSLKILQQPLAVVRFLINQYPDSFKQVATNGELPLHAACRCGKPSLEVVQLLLFLCPESLYVKTVGGLTPLQMAQNVGIASKEVIEFLETATHIQEHLGNFPTTRKQLDETLSKCEELYGLSKKSEEPKAIIEGIAAERILSSLTAFRQYLPTRDELQQKLDTVSQAMKDENLDLEARLSLSLEHFELRKKIEKEGMIPVHAGSAEDPEVVTVN